MLHSGELRRLFKKEFDFSVASKTIKTEVLVEDFLGAWLVNRAPGLIGVGRVDDQSLRSEVYASQRHAHKKNDIPWLRLIAYLIVS